MLVGGLMPKAIKFRNDIYLSTNSIMHWHHNLYTIIDALSNPKIKEDFAYATDGFEILYQNVYEQWSHYFGTIIVKKSSGVFVPAQDLPIKFNKTVRGHTNFMCTLTDGVWQSKGIGYAYCGGKGIYIADSNGTGKYNIAKIIVDFIGT